MYNFRVPTRVADTIYFTADDDLENVSFNFKREDGDLIYKTAPYKKINKGTELWFSPDRLHQCTSVIIEMVKYGKVIHKETIPIS